MAQGISRQKTKKPGKLCEFSLEPKDQAEEEEEEESEEGEDEGSWSGGRIATEVNEGLVGICCFVVSPRCF